MAASILSSASSPAHLDKIEKLKQWEDALKEVTEQLKKGINAPSVGLDKIVGFGLESGDQAEGRLNPLRFRRSAPWGEKK